MTPIPNHARFHATLAARLALWPLVALAACGALPGDIAPPGAPAAPPAGGPDNHIDEVQDPHEGVITLALENAPEDMGCLNLEAIGPNRSKSEQFDLVPGQTRELNLTGYPLGLVRLNANAFSQACDKVSVRTVPAWIGEGTEVSVVAGTKANASLKMVRNGRLDVAVDFGGEPACSAEGQSCKSVRECCSGACRAGLCIASEAP